MPTAAELIAQADAATSEDELEQIEDQAEGRVTVLQAIDEARDRLKFVPPEPSPPTGHTTDPDFVWVGCNVCWQPKDASRPVRAYAEWLNDGYRYLAYTCAGCSEIQGRTVQVHSTLYGLWMEDAHTWEEGAIAAEPTEVKRWGGDARQQAAVGAFAVPIDD